MGGNGMKTVVIASQKGGSGKTALTRNLATAADLADDGPVFVVDTDPQASLTKWFKKRRALDPVPQWPAMLKPTPLENLEEELAALAAAGVRYVFIDTQGANVQRAAEAAAVIRLADLVIIPVKPSPDDLDAAADTLKTVLALHKPFMFVLTMVKPNANITGQAQGVLDGEAKKIPAGLLSRVFVGDRVDYASSAIDGRTVLETDPAGRSAAEMVALWTELRAILGDPNAGQKKQAA